MTKAFIGLILFSSIFASCRNAAKKKIARAKEINIGESIEEVKRKLGDPGDSAKGYFDSAKIMFIYDLGKFESGDIEVYFDSTTKRVTNIVVPKGE